MAVLADINAADAAAQTARELQEREKKLIVGRADARRVIEVIDEICCVPKVRNRPWPSRDMPGPIRLVFHAKHLVSGKSEHEIVEFDFPDGLTVARLDQNTFSLRSPKGDRTLVLDRYGPLWLVFSSPKGFWQGNAAAGPRRSHGATADAGSS